MVQILSVEKISWLVLLIKNITSFNYNHLIALYLLLSSIDLRIKYRKFVFIYIIYISFLLNYSIEIIARLLINIKNFLLLLFFILFIFVDYHVPSKNVRHYCYTHTIDCINHCFHYLWILHTHTHASARTFFFLFYIFDFLPFFL